MDTTSAILILVFIGIPMLLVLWVIGVIVETIMKKEDEDFDDVEVIKRVMEEKDG